VHLLDYQAKALARGFTILYNTIKNSWQQKQARGFFAPLHLAWLFTYH
jgi:hypothetical protein